MKNLVLFIVLVFGGMHSSAAITNPANPPYFGYQDDKPVHKELTCTKFGDDDYKCVEKAHKTEDTDELPMPIKLFFGLVAVAAAWLVTRK